MNRKDIIAGLREERVSLVTRKAELDNRIAAIDNALVGFGCKPVAKRVVRRRSEGELRELETRLLQGLKDLGEWVGAIDLANLLELPLNGTLYNALDRLAARELIERKKTGESVRSPVLWRDKGQDNGSHLKAA